MIDHFSIFTRGGLVLWTFQLSALKGNPIDALIRTCLLEERSGETSFSFGQDAAAYTLKWTFHNDLGLVFVAVYQRILQLLYVDELLTAVKKEFSGVYEERRYHYPEFNDVYHQLHAEAEARAVAARRSKSIAGFADTKKGRDKQKQTSSSRKHSGKSIAGVRKGTQSDEDADAEDANCKSGTQAGPGVSSDGPSGGGEAGGDGVSAFDVSKLKKRASKPTQKPADPLEAALRKKKGSEGEGKKKTKEMRVWDDTPTKQKLNYSDEPDSQGEKVAVVDVSHGQKSRMDVEDDAEELSDEDEEEEVANEGAGQGKQEGNGSMPQKKGWFSSVFQSIAGKAALDRKDLAPALKQLKERLMTKNVAEEIAEKLCESVATSLVGRKQASFTLVSSTVQTAMEDALLRILTPKHSVDILRDVHDAKEAGRPYIVVFVGVNGVGKSTNLAKVAYWLLQHEIRPMIAACDTFRSGAVEQLRTHCRRLSVELFEKGYEKDPASVAKDAISYAMRSQHDVVLVDTAGRMQDNEPLMKALAKLINLNSPDLVLFVGEALVGNDAVDQLKKFNQRLADLSTQDPPRLVDGIVLTKFDTIDDKVGAALSMVYISGSPIMFVGCGQTYTDLRKLNVKQIVKTLLK